MKVSDRIVEVESIYRFDDVETAERFFEQVLEEVDMLASAGETPENSRIKILHDENVVTIITDKTACSMLFEDFDD